MEQTESIGALLKVMYSDEPAYSEWIDKIAQDMIANKKVIRQYERIHDNLQSQVEECEEDFLGFRQHCRAREDARIYYDHYRLKMETLNEKAAKLADKAVTSTTYTFSS